MQAVHVGVSSTPLLRMADGNIVLLSRVFTRYV